MPCPQCGNSAAVHSINELADLARMQLSQVPGAPSQPSPQQGWAAEPVAGPVPGPGYAGTPRSGPIGGGWPRRTRDMGDVSDSVEGAIADVALGAAAQFIGRAIRKRVEKTMNERIMPTLAATKETMLREQIAIAEKYPDICACMTDHVVFLTGGNRVLPMPNLQTLTLAQADGMVAQLRS